MIKGKRKEAKGKRICFSHFTFHVSPNNMPMWRQTAVRDNENSAEQKLLNIIFERGRAARR